MLANDDAVQAVGTFCHAHNITTGPVNNPDGRDMVVLCDGAMDAERRWPPSNFTRLAAAISTKWPGLNVVLTDAPSRRLLFRRLCRTRQRRQG